MHIVFTIYCLWSYCLSLSLPQCGDILKEECLQEMAGLMDVVLDKGTYDAISLSPEEAKTKRQEYTKSVLKLLKRNSIFIIVSCNWTQDELKDHFSDGKQKIVLHCTNNPY